MKGLTAADFADTGQWRLILKIYMSGMVAHLENTLHPDIEPQLLFSSGWEADAANQLRNIENAVYDHPRVLDDFSAKIIIFDRRCVFIPTEIAEDGEGPEETIYTSLYESNPEDVITDTDGDVTVAYSPAPGLKGFLSRTFPGARIECNLMEQLRKYRKEGEGKRLYVTVREDEADFILIDGRNLISASTHGWTAGGDIVYHGFNILDVYGVSAKEVICHLSGDKIPEETKDAFNRHLHG